MTLLAVFFFFLTEKHISWGKNWNEILFGKQKQICLTGFLIPPSPIEVKLPFPHIHTSSRDSRKSTESFASAFYDGASRKCLPGGLPGHMEWEGLGNHLPFPSEPRACSKNASHSEQGRWCMCTAVQHRVNVHTCPHPLRMCSCISRKQPEHGGQRSSKITPSRMKMC